jgi:xanthine dehydrogenase accessory factor
VASMGQADEETLEAALSAPAGYIGLVASAKRGTAVLADLRAQGLDEETLTRIRCPAGLDLGPSSQEEIAVAILAELVAWRHTKPGSTAELVEAVDPVCGMTVAIAGARETAVHDGRTYYFCGPGCRSRFEADPARYLAVA